MVFHLCRLPTPIVFAFGFLLSSTSSPTRSEEADPFKPPAIETAKVPPLPASLVNRLEQYMDVRAASFAGWDPAGKGLLIRTRFGNSLQLHRVYEPGGRREQVTFFREPVDGGFLPGATDESLLVTMSAGGNENGQIYFHDRARFKTQRLTDGKSRNSINAVRDDGSQMIVASNQRNGRDTDLYLADPRAADSMKLLFQTDRQFWSAVDWSLDGKTLLLSRFVSANESYPYLMHVADAKTIELPRPTNELASYGPLAFAPDGKSIYVATDATSEFSRLARLNLASGKYEWLTADIDWSVSGLEVDPKSGRVAFSVNEDGASRLFMLEPTAAGKLVRRELKLPLGIVSSLDFSPDGKQLGFTLSRPEAPADVYSLELAGDALTRWTYSEVGGLNPASFVTPTRIRFKSFDAREIPAYYYRPKGAAADKKAPVIINIHGGPEGQAQPFFTGTTQFYLNELGAAVIFPNVRGSSGYGKTYLKLDNAELREDSVKDIGALLDWIAKQDELDASRVAVTGGSYGGYMVLASLVHYSDRLKAGIDNVGIANFNTLLATTAAYRQDLRRAEYGDERDPKMKEFFERISPANNAEKIRARLLVAHGRNDPRVPFTEAQQIAEKVRSFGRPVWTVYAANEGHGFAKKDNADYLRAVEAMFLSRSFGLE